MFNKVVTRFAPSPTGLLHIGGVRTALFCWLLARRYDGIFILRIEDTDLTRSTDDNIRVIEDGMQWLGLEWDEGPVIGNPGRFIGPHGCYRQTLRMDLYHSKIEELLHNKLAYRCRCTREELEKKRMYAESIGKVFLYDGYCRDKNWDATVPYVVRFCMPKDGDIVINDLIKGQITVPANSLDDWIIARIDGTPTYNFCVVVDDNDMCVTHVLRGDDHLANTPKQIALYDAFKYKLPAFAHVPMILGSDKQKLSKRHGASSIMELRNQGFLPSAVRLALAKLSWTPRNLGRVAENAYEEILTDDDLIKAFNIADIKKSAAVFDIDKLTWINQKILQKLQWYEIEPHLKWQYHLRGQELDWNTKSDEWKEMAINCSKKCATLKDMADSLDFIFVRPKIFDEAAVIKFIKPLDKKIFRSVCKITDYRLNIVKQEFNYIMLKNDITLSMLAQALRVAFTGKTISPPIFDTMILLGHDEVNKRLEIWM